VKRRVAIRLVSAGRLPENGKVYASDHTAVGVVAGTRDPGADLL
jgi:hypothetical protein